MAGSHATDFVVHRTQGESEIVDPLKQLEEQLASLQEQMEKVQLSREAAEKTATAPVQPPPEADLCSLDIDAGTATVGGNRRIYLNLLKTFLQEHAQDLEKIEKKLDAGAVKEVAGIVHTLKGVTPAIGAKRLADITRRFNEAIVLSKMDLLPGLLAEMQVEYPVVLEAIASVLASEVSEEQELAAKPVSIAEIAEKTETLAALIKNMDMDAGEYAAQFMAQLEEWGYLDKGEADPLHDHIYNFEFEQAAEDFAVIRQKIEQGVSGDAK